MVTWKDRTTKIFREFLKNSEESDNPEEIVGAASRIISEDIRKCTKFSRSDPVYPDLTKFDAVTMKEGIPILINLTVLKPDN